MSFNINSGKQRLPDVLSTEQLVALFDTIDRPKVAIGAAIGFFCGLRISEVCKLKVEDIDLERKRLKVEDSKYTARSITGYGKDRYVPIPGMMISPLKKWIEIIHGGKWLMPSHNSPNSHITKKVLGSEFRYSLDMAGLSQIKFEYYFTKGPFKGKVKNKHKYNFHTLRHSYATYLTDKGVDIYTISTLLGHNQVTTTQIYARVSDSQRVRAVNQAFNISMSSQIRQPVPYNYVSSEGQNQDIELIKLKLKSQELELRKLELLQKLSLREIELK